MPMLMLKCKTCGQIFSGKYVDEGLNNDNDYDNKSSQITKINLDSKFKHSCLRGHQNDYVVEDYVDLS